MALTIITPSIGRFVIADGFCFDGTMTQDIDIQSCGTVESILDRAKNMARYSGAWAEALQCGPIRISTYDGTVIGWLFLSSRGVIVARKGEDIPMGTAYFRNYADNPFVSTGFPSRVVLTPADDFDWEANNMRETMLTCRNHQDLRWMTKHLFQRSLHFMSFGENECQCHLSDLMTMRTI